MGQPNDDVLGGGPAGARSRTTAACWCGRIASSPGAAAGASTIPARELARRHGTHPRAPRRPMDRHPKGDPNDVRALSLSVLDLLAEGPPGAGGEGARVRLARDRPDGRRSARSGVRQAQPEPRRAHAGARRRRADRVDADQRVPRRGVPRRRRCCRATRAGVSERLWTKRLDDKVHAATAVVTFAVGPREHRPAATRRGPRGQHRRDPGSARARGPAERDRARRRGARVRGALRTMLGLLDQMEAALAQRALALGRAPSASPTPPCCRTSCASTTSA